MHSKLPWQEREFSFNVGKVIFERFLSMNRFSKRNPFVTEIEIETELGLNRMVNFSSVASSEILFPMASANRNRVLNNKFSGEVVKSNDGGLREWRACERDH